MKLPKPNLKRLQKATSLLAFDTRYRDRGLKVIAGIDEAGRGPLAGPVVASAVILPPGWIFENIDDSKKLTPFQRESCFAAITQSAISIGIGIVSPEVIDRVNILQATYQAVRDSLEQLTVKPDGLLLDALRLKDYPTFQEYIIKGDQQSLSIASASIIAKVTRDRLMVAYDRIYPGYGFASHKGYGTAEHYKALNKLGPCPIHRKSFLKNWYEPELFKKMV